MRLLTVMLMAVAVTLAPQLASAQSSPSTNSASEADIKALDANLNSLIIRAAWDDYANVLASAFTRVSPDGRLQTKDEVMSEFRSGPRKILALEPEEVRVRFFGDTAISQGILTESFREAGRVNTRRERFTRVFVKEDGAWHLVSEQFTTIGK